MAITLKLYKPLYSLYSKDEDMFVYGNLGFYSYGLVPKSSGMASKLETVLQKRQRHIDKADEMIQLEEDKRQRGNFQHHSFLPQSIENWKKKKAIAEAFVVVKVSVEEV